MEKEKLDQLIEKVGGREKLTLILQRRLKELAGGDAPKVENAPADLIEAALLEILEGKIDLTVTVPTQRQLAPSYESSGRPSPMMRAPRPGPRPGGPMRRPGVAPGGRPGGGMRRQGPPRRGGGGGGGGNRGGGRWQGPR
jgi:DNA-directed RNA polymerase subunit K/omega